MRKISRALLVLLTAACMCFAYHIHGWAEEAAQKWAFAIGSDVASSPVIGEDGTIYVGAEDCRLYAVGPDGTEKWAFKTGGSMISSPAIGPDGTIYVGSGDGRLYAINQDGTLKWAYQTSDGVYSSPVIAQDGTIYVASWDHRVYALAPDGLLRWTFETGNSIFSSPAIASDGTIYVGSSDGRLYAIEGGGRSRAEGAADAQTAAEEGLKEIREIRFEAEEEGEERLVFLLNGVFSPKVSTLDGDRPRVVCDFAGARLAGNISQEIKVVGAAVQRIETSLNGPGNEGVRVVAEVNPGAAGMLAGPFFDEEYVYAGGEGYLYMLILKTHQSGEMGNQKGD